MTQTDRDRVEAETRWRSLSAVEQHAVCAAAIGKQAKVAAADNALSTEGEQQRRLRARKKLGAKTMDEAVAIACLAGGVTWTRSR